MIKRWWRRRQRAIDFKVLAPSFKEQAPDDKAATKAACYHISMDPAWREASHLEIIRFIRACGGNCDYLLEQYGHDDMLPQDEDLTDGVF